MTLVKCPNCGNERDLTYDQIKTIATENRHCPSCGMATERVVIREERFQPLTEFIKVTPQSVTYTTQIGTITPDTSGSDHEILPAETLPEPSPENEEETPPSGITVGPGGSVKRKPRRSTR